MPKGVNPDVAKVMGIPTTISRSGPSGNTALSGSVLRELENASAEPEPEPEPERTPKKKRSYIRKKKSSTEE